MSGNRIERQVEALLDDAEEAMRRGAWARVEMLAGAAARLDPRSQDARVYVYAARLERGRLRRALRHLLPTWGLHRRTGTRGPRRIVLALGRRTGRTLMAGFTMLGAITFALIVLTSALSWRSASTPGERAAPVTTSVTSPLSVGAGEASAGEVASATASAGTHAAVEPVVQPPTSTVTFPPDGPASTPGYETLTLDATGPRPAEPPLTSTVTYVVRAGDTFLLVASEHGVTVEELLALNGRSTDDWLYEGELILLPGPVD